MDVLIAEHVSDWVMGLQLKRIAPEKRQLILAVKAEIVDALHRYFFGGQMAQPTPEPEAETASQAGPAGGESGAAADSPRERLFAALDDVQEGLHGMRAALRDLWKEEQARDEHLARSQRALAGRVEVVEEWVKSLDGRVAGMGQGDAAESGWLPLLSGAHLAEMRALLRSLEQATGRTQAQLEQELVETFRVAAINALPEEQ